MFVIHVAVPVPLRQHFSYLSERRLEAGIRVRVPFGNRRLVGIVLHAENAQEISDNKQKLKLVESVLDDEAIIPKSFLALGKWLADYYHHAIGETLSTLIPAWLRSTREGAVLKQLLSEKRFSLTHAGEQGRLTLNSNAKQQAGLLDLLQATDLAESVVRKDYSSTTINTLLKKQWIEKKTHIPSASTSWSTTLEIGVKPLANPEQGAAIGVISSQLNQFSVSLLDGVTGSGKTEVYLQVIESVLMGGQQVLVLVPEIGLTPQTVSRFESRFGCQVGVLHSQVSDKKRLQIWLQAKQGNLPLVIGTRSAVFTPFYKLGLIVVDEEHDDSFKQQDGLRYHARDVAAVRAQRHNIPLILGSATPSLESLNNALSGRYQYLQLQSRAGNANFPRQFVQDMRNHPIQGGLAEHVIERIHQHLLAGTQVLVFLNRRGFAPSLICHSCGHVEVCHECDRPMTWHRNSGLLRCHHCDIQRSVPSRCTHCNSEALIGEGIGTEQLEQQLQSLFPSASVTRIDRDATRSKTALETKFNEIKAGKHQLLVGTQIMAKGHHFPEVTLVVIVDADGALFSADVRATEKFAQLVTQLSGRAGRAEKPGEMWLQTHQPGHPVVQELLHNGYEHVARSLLAERKEAGAIPFVAQAIIRAESADKIKAFEALQIAKTACKVSSTVSLIGPMPTLMERRQGRFRMMLIIQSPERRALHQQLHFAINALVSNKLSKQVRWNVDVDAIEVT